MNSNGNKEVLENELLSEEELEAYFGSSEEIERFKNDVENLLGIYLA